MYDAYIVWSVYNVKELVHSPLSLSFADSALNSRLKRALDSRSRRFPIWTSKTSSLSSIWHSLEYFHDTSTFRLSRLIEAQDFARRDPRENWNSTAICKRIDEALDEEEAGQFEK